MSVSKLPSVETLVNRIKNRIKCPQTVKNKGNSYFDKKNIP